MRSSANLLCFTWPDEATEEINALDTVVGYARSAYPGEQDFIVMWDCRTDLLVKNA